MQEPLSSLDQWDDEVRSRYREGRKEEEFRNYGEDVHPRVREFYKLNHTQQTVDLNREKRREWLKLNRCEKSVWDLMEELNALVDDSDPDTDLSQIDHNLQTAEAMRADGQPRWMQLTGLIHDLGKVLWLWGEPQWAVVGDTFPVGCSWSEKIVFHEYFRDNPDRAVPEYQTECGLYGRHCGLDRVMLSWGHDEYLYHVTRAYLPEEAQAMIRFHSCYPIHREGAYDWLMNDGDRRLMEWVRKFNPYDLYSKGHQKPDADALRPYYQDLIAEYFPDRIRW
jgi:inositol oxygenase